MQPLQPRTAEPTGAHRTLPGVFAFFGLLACLCFGVGCATTRAPHATATSSPSSRIILQDSGHTNKSTARFTVRGAWQLSWTCQHPGTVLHIQVSNLATGEPDTSFQHIMYACPKNGGGDSILYHGSGTFYLAVASDLAWTITITDIPD
jgi:hypothetical protein